MLLGEVLAETKAADILYELEKGPKNVRGLQEALGGGFTTIEQRINTLESEGLIEEAKDQGPGRVVCLSERGKGVIGVLHWFETNPPDQISKALIEGEGTWILVILRVLGVVKGSTRLEKLLFLLKEKFKVVEGPSYEFKPYRFGPYSPKVLDDARNLQSAGLVAITEETFEVHDLSDFVYARKNYMITDKGSKVADALVESLSPDAKQALYKLKMYNSMSLQDLLDFVYQNFPQFSPPND